MTVEETIEWIDQRIELCDVTSDYCPPVINERPFKGFQIDELRWREETDSAVQLLLMGESPTNQSTPVRYYLVWRLLGARRALIPLKTAQLKLPFPAVLESYLILSWPPLMLESYLRSAVSALFEGLPENDSNTE
jgi:hypothetical protein